MHLFGQSLVQFDCMVECFCNVAGNAGFIQRQANREVAFCHHPQHSQQLLRVYNVSVIA
jgi:hypothetical protein